MSLLLPPNNHPAREFIDINYLAKLGSTQNFPTFSEAKYNAKKAFSITEGVKAIHTVCMRANGEIWLIKFGPRGGWCKIWNFSK